MVSLNFRGRSRRRRYGEGNGRGRHAGAAHLLKLGRNILEAGLLQLLRKQRHDLQRFPELGTSLEF